MTTLASGYEPKDFESRLYAEWEASGVFAPQGDGPAYTILLPPPNVTGTLHMGHAFQHTLQDALIRYHRMRGYRTLWQMGTDHAGIATEMVVSRNLQLAGASETRDSLGRDKFIDRVWEWKHQSGGTIERQMRRLGASGDWTRSVFTMDAMASDAVIEAFVRLYEQGLIYRGQKLVNWDPVLKTAISDLEVVSEEENGFLWSIAYPLANGETYEHVEHDADGNETLRETRDYLIVATTRPETMLGDTAVMVHPEDPRYTHLIGKTVLLPLCDRELPIIADDYVDRAFGTGVVKVTPAHDFNDNAVWQRHVGTGVFDALPNRGLINIFSPSARILHEPDGWIREGNTSTRDRTHNGGPDVSYEHAVVNRETYRLAAADLNTLDSIPQKYQGLDRFEARKLIVADLEAAGLLVETKPHKLQVPRGDRTGQVIEPYLTDQWFVKMEALAHRGLELVENGSVKFVPPNWINTYRHWLENIQDWCISRQLWWGHRIPAWFDATNEPHVARDEEGARKKLEEKIQRISSEIQSKASKGEEHDLLSAQLNLLSKRQLLQDKDVLETWFSSALWPISTMGWPNAETMRERGFDAFVPSSVLVTGFDILFFWVARMVMMTDHFMPAEAPDAERVPFRDVYITGLVRDKDGQKMSKSKGNILDPLDIIDGISEDDLVAKRTTGLMKPQDAPKIEKATRKEFAGGIAPHGADALRFTMAALAGPGRDIKFDMARCEGYKNFCNKLWNATRFVLMNTEGFTASGHPRPQTPAEHWILSKLDNVADEVIGYFGRLPEEQADRDPEDQQNQYRFDLAAKALYEFAWNVYCDDFVEASKQALQSGNQAAADSTRHTLLYVLESILRLLHPMIPFVTDELWRHVAPKLSISGNTICQQPYPKESRMADVNQANDFEHALGAAHQIRALRSQMNIPPSKRATLLIEGGAPDNSYIGRHSGLWTFLSKLESVRKLEADETPPPSMMIPFEGMKFHIPLEGLVDLDAERVRLDKEIARVSTEKDKSEAKLGKFGGNVPPAVVEQERQRLADWTAKLEALQAQRARLG